MPGKIPNHIVSPQLRTKLAEIIKNLDVLKKHHAKLIKKAKAGPLSSKERDLLKDIIKAHNALEKQFKSLTPSLEEIAIRLARQKTKE